MELPRRSCCPNLDARADPSGSGGLDCLAASKAAGCGGRVPDEKHMPLQTLPLLLMLLVVALAIRMVVVEVVMVVTVDDIHCHYH